MAQDYDKVFRETIEATVIPLLGLLLKLEPVSMESIPDTLPRTIERRPDFLKKVKLKGIRQPIILHIEFQLKDERRMLARMLEYYGILYRRYGLAVHQYVIFLGPNTPRMLALLTEKNITFQFTVVNLATLDYRLFLQSNNPAEIVLAILGDFGLNAPNAVITEIVTRLKALYDGSAVFEKYFRQLEILSSLRNLQKQTIDRLTDMALIYDLKTDLRYQQGQTEGRTEGRTEGIEEKQRTIITKLLRQGKLSVEDIAEVAEVSLENVRQIQRQIN